MKRASSFELAFFCLNMRKTLSPKDSGLSINPLYNTSLL